MMTKKTESNPKGAGRPEVDIYLKRVPFNCRLPTWLVVWLRDQDDSQSEIIETAIIAHHQLNKEKLSNP